MLNLKANTGTLPSLEVLLKITIHRLPNTNCSVAKSPLTTSSLEKRDIQHL